MPDDPILERDPAAKACLDRTRSGVLNVLVVVGASIAISGFALGRMEAGATDWDFDRTRRAALLALAGLAALSHVVRRSIASRTALAEPKSRCSRFYRAHVLSAIIGAGAAPLGIAYGWAIHPRLPSVAPFWVAALGIGFLSLPRGYELDGFDTPMIDGSEHTT